MSDNTPNNKMVASNRKAMTASQEGSALVSMIREVALTPEMDVAKLERLLDMQERILDKQAEVAYSEALAAMQGEMPTIAERGKAIVKGETRYTYALWEDVNAAIKPILQRHGFSLSFRTETDDRIKVTGILRHVGGHHEETSITLPSDSSGNKNAVQAVASAISYGKRYCAGALLNLTSYGEDDDAFSAGCIDDHQADEIRRLITQTGADRDRFLRWIGARSISEISATKYAQAEAMLRRKLSTSEAQQTPPADEVIDAQETPPNEDPETPTPPSSETTEAANTPPEEPPQTPPAPTISAAQKRRLEARIREVDASREGVKKWIQRQWGVAHFQDLTQDQYFELDAKLDQMQQPASEAS